MTLPPDTPSPDEEIEEALAETELPPDLGHTVIRGAGLAGGGYVLAQALNLGFYLALARLATPADFGDLAAASLIVGISLLVTESGMMSAVIQRRDRLEEAANTALVSTALAGLLFSLVALAASPLIGMFFDSDRVGHVAAALSGVIFLRTLTTVPDALLQRRFSFFRRVIIEPLGVVAFGVAAVIATSNGLGVWGLVIGQYAFTVNDLILSWVFVRWRPRLRLASFGMWRELVAYGRHILVATTILRVGEQADTIWLGRFLGAAPLGQYRYGYRLSSTPYTALLAGASYVLFPAFARIAEQRERFEAAFRRALGWMSFVAFPSGLMLLALGQPLAVILFGDVWRAAGGAAMAMCLYPAMSSLSSIASEALKAHGRPDLLTRMHTLTTVLTAALMGALLPLGLNGVAAALSIGAAVSGVYAISLVHRTIGFSLADMVAEIWPSAAAALAMGLPLLALDRLVVHAGDHATAPGALLLSGEAAAGGLVFLAVSAILQPQRLRELRAGAGRVLRRRSEGRAA
jgi:PST family polysaccharide transporter